MHARSTLLAVSLLLATAARAQDFTVISSNLWMTGTKGYDSVTAQQPLGVFVNVPGFANFYKNRVAGSFGVIGMQEISNRAANISFMHVPKLVVNAMGYGWGYRFQGLRSYYSGKFGNAVATNAVIRSYQDWRFAFSSTNSTDYGKEQRGAMAMKLDFGGKQLWFVNTHLSYKKSGSPKKPVAIRQAWQMMGKIKTFDPDYPVIAVGDFNVENTPGGSAAYGPLKAIFGNAGFVDISNYWPTIMNQPTTTATGQLDYIFVYDPHNKLTVRSCYALNQSTGSRIHSDHRAVIARFRWK